MDNSKLTAYDHELLKALGDEQCRQTFYQLSTKVSFDDATLIERLKKLTELGYVNEMTNNGKTRYNRNTQ